MRLWPFGRGLETRDDSYTDALIAAITSRASGATLALPTTTAALEACSGLVGRSFAACEVSARPVVSDALKPDSMALIGRSLIRRGRTCDAD